VIAVTLFDLVSYERGFQPAIPLKEANPPTPAAIAQLQKTQGHQRVGAEWELGANVAERYHLRDARIYRSPPLERRGRLWGELGGVGTDLESLTPDTNRLSNLYAVRYQISYEIPPSKQWQPKGVKPVIENNQAFPRAWVAYSWKPARNLGDALAKVGANGGHDEDAPVIESAPPAPAGPPAKPGAARFLRDGDSSVKLAIDAARPGQLILDDTWYPGWQAKVDGHEATIRPANASFRAVAVPAGRHTVSFDYRPASLWLGALLSLIGVLLLAAGFLFFRGGRRRAGRTGADTPRGAPAATTAPPA
jgi:hypothetical protein